MPSTFSVTPEVHVLVVQSSTGICWIAKQLAMESTEVCLTCLEAACILTSNIVKCSCVSSIPACAAEDSTFQNKRRHFCGRDQGCPRADQRAGRPESPSEREGSA